MSGRAPSFGHRRDAMGCGSSRPEVLGQFDASRLSRSMREHVPQRLWNVREIESFDEEARVPGLAAALRSDKATELVLRCAPAMGRHLLKRAKGTEFALRLDHLLDRRGAQRSNEFVFEVGDAHLDVQIDDAGTLRGTADAGGFSIVAHHCHAVSRGEALEVRAHVRYAVHRYDLDTPCSRIAAQSSRECLKRDPVALAFDEDDCAWCH